MDCTLLAKKSFMLPPSPEMALLIGLPVGMVMASHFCGYWTGNRHGDSSALVCLWLCRPWLLWPAFHRLEWDSLLFRKKPHPSSVRPLAQYELQDVQCYRQR